MEEENLNIQTLNDKITEILPRLKEMQKPYIEQANEEIHWQLMHNDKLTSDELYNLRCTSLSTIYDNEEYLMIYKDAIKTIKEADVPSNVKNKYYDMIDIVH